MRGKMTGILYKKEMTDFFRDKKTVFVSIILPVIMYPLIFIIAMQVVSSNMIRSEKDTYKVAFSSESAELIDDFSRWIDSSENKAKYSFRFESDDSDMTSKSAKKILNAKDCDLAISTRKKANGQIAVRVYYLSGNNKSNSAVDYLDESLSAYSKTIAKGNLKKEGLDPDYYLDPIVSKASDLSSGESTVGTLLSQLLPLLLIIGIITGAVTPAIDASAGEKERGTLETLMTFPVTGQEILTGKFLAVATISVISVLMNALSVIIILIYILSTMSGLGIEPKNIDLFAFTPAIIITVLVMVTMALFLSALLMAIGCFANSYKEAGNYTGPVTMVSLVAAYAGFVPGIKLEGIWQIIPVSNVSLLLRDVLKFDVNYSAVVVVMLSNMIYAFAAVWILGRVFTSERVLFGIQGESMRLLDRRSNMRPGSMMRISESIFVMVLALLIMNLAGAPLTVRNPVAGIAFQQAVIGLLPLLFAYYIKGDMKRIFSLRPIRPLSAISAVIIGIGAVSFNLALSNVLSPFLKDSATKINEEYGNLLGQISFPAAFILIAILPPICEELMFRGAILSSFREAVNGKIAAVISAILFGIMHMSLIKLPVTAILGFIIAITVMMSGSIFGGSIIHFINNGLSVILMYNGEKFLPKSIVNWADGNGGNISITVIAFISAAVLLFAGFILMRYDRKRAGGR
jgi:sodium transport system permease protein